jgi:hypothetical protein
LSYISEKAERYILILIISVFSSCVACKNVSANTVTPSHVFHVALELESELALLHKASYSMPVASRVKVAERQPRHVYQKAREVFIKVQQLRFLHGLSHQDIPNVPTEEVTPKDVKNIVSKILFEVRAIKQRVGVNWKIEDATQPQGKSPTDVYMQMTFVSSLISQLDIPNVLPNEVYQVALSMIDTLRSIHSKKNTGQDYTIKHVSKNKKPLDVYKVVERLFPLLNKLCESSKEYCIKGGSIQPLKVNKNIAPADVITILNDLFADVASIKVAIGDKSPTAIAAPQTGKTPSNVFDAMITAEKMIRALK